MVESFCPLRLFWWFPCQNRILIKIIISFHLFDFLHLLIFVRFEFARFKNFHQISPHSVTMILMHIFGIWGNSFSICFCGERFVFFNSSSSLSSSSKPRGFVVGKTSGFRTGEFPSPPKSSSSSPYSAAASSQVVYVSHPSAAPYRPSPTILVEQRFANSLDKSFTSFRCFFSAEFSMMMRQQSSSFSPTAASSQNIGGLNGYGFDFDDV